MTEQQIIQLLAGIREKLWSEALRQSLKRTFWSTGEGLRLERLGQSYIRFFLSRGFIHICLLSPYFVIGALGYIFGGWGVMDMLPLFLLVFLTFLSFLSGIGLELSQDMKKPQSVRIWEYFLDHYRRNQETLNEQTEELSSRIRSLYQLDEKYKAVDGYQLDDGPSILRVEQAAQLLNIYEKERRRLIEVDRELKSNESRHQEIEPHIAALKKRHGEINQEGEYQLKMLSMEKKSLLAAKSQFEQSVNNLELILKAAEDERDARAHHRFISQKVGQYSKSTLPGSNEASRTDVLRELEEGIAAEIKAYVEIEAELRRETDSVQVAVQPSITQAPGTKNRNRAASELPKLVKEEIHGEVIEYYPLGEYVVIQPGVQSGLPTIKNTRITAGAILGWSEQGDRPEDIAQGYGIPLAAVQEAIQLAEVYDYERSYL